MSQGPEYSRIQQERPSQSRARAGCSYTSAVPPLWCWIDCLIYLFIWHLFTVMSAAEAWGGNKSPDSIPDNSDGLPQLQRSHQAWVLCYDHITSHFLLCLILHVPFPSRTGVAPEHSSAPFTLISSQSQLPEEPSLQQGATWKANRDTAVFKSWLHYLVAEWLWASYLTCQFHFSSEEKDYYKD